MLSVRRIFASSRFFILIAVLATFVASAATMVYGGIATVLIIVRAFAAGDYSQKNAKLLTIDMVSMIDLFLLGTVMYIIAVGLYELFIDSGLPMPGWLRITTLDDLEERLLSVVVVLLAVTFLGSAVTWDGTTSILSLGAAVALVIGVISGTIGILARIRREP
jgi:uncharacterized membrane protein YqhA